MSLYAIILAEVEKGQTLAAQEGLAKLSAVGLVVPTAGPFDLLVWVKSDNPTNLGKAIITEVQTTPGIKSTLTLFILEEFVAINWLKEYLAESSAVEALTDARKTAPSQLSSAQKG